MSKSPNAESGDGCTGAERKLEKESRRHPTPFDLEERTALFGEAVVRFARKIRADPVSSPLITQLVRAGTSIGANYCEADDAVSKKEFRVKINTCRKEARETKYHLRVIAAAVPELADEARVLWREAKELHLIFCAIFRKLASP